MAPKHEFQHEAKLDVEARVRQRVEAVLEEVLREEMTKYPMALYRELTPTRKGERNSPRLGASCALLMGNGWIS